MKKINNDKLKNMYIEKYGINKIFSTDLSNYMELYLFSKDQYICRENESINYLFFYVKGKAKVYSTLSNGKSLLLCIYTPLNLLGDMELLDYSVASRNVKTIEDSYCIGLSLDKVRDVLLNDIKFLRYASSCLAKKLNIISKNSAINLLYPLENRLASYILATKECVICDSKEILIFNENLSEVCELLGTSYRHLLRVLQGLCNKNIIAKSDGCYEILNNTDLQELAQDLYIE